MLLEKNVKNKIDRIRRNKVFQKAKEDCLLLKILKKHTALMDRAYN
jgi:hypothetical protein